MLKSVENIHGYTHKSFKKRVKSGNSGGRLKDLYSLMFRQRGILPDILARQRPLVLFDMLDKFGQENEPSMDNVPDDLKWMYGE